MSIGPQWTIALALLVAACGATPTSSPSEPPANDWVPSRLPEAGAPPSASSVPAPPSAEAWRLPPRTPRAPRKAAYKELTIASLNQAKNVKGVPPAPAGCSSWANRKPSNPARLEFSEALSVSDPDQRDAVLAEIESRSAIDKQLDRTVRADLAPVECADVLTDPYLKGTARLVHGSELDHALVGLSVAAKLSRAGNVEPPPATRRDAEKLARWLDAQAAVLGRLGEIVEGLADYGHAVALTEQGLAELRLAESVRSLAERALAERSGLDRSLAQRVSSGEKLLRAGLEELADVGAVYDPRVGRARAELGRLHPERPLAALDSLLLVPESAAAADPHRSSYWRYFVRYRDRDASKKVPARELFDRARAYWRGEDFVEAAHVAAAEGSAPETRLVLALSLALARGPRNVTELLALPGPGLGLGHTDALDALAAEKGPLAGLAAFDAAHLRSLSTPEGDARAHWRDVATRFRTASSQLVSAEHKKLAAERAAAADALAK